ncbi:prevent-host-death family protein [Rhizobium sp. RU20A]|uniref:type II toxin-antitoxin system Phd/YefM family antitoxin n=1 Tax=Rhizobium sp. RU20A TaxID=1907412 RepID=UPI000954D9F8|nr:type II toxin-antitoxin system prevent-host-death family antitoxin [Rhizobium sp. RU20A]SIQ28244.1 prevent-host-death family protein [Rhizobium sp. RU20A]
MPVVNMLEAKTRLSQLVAAVEDGSESEIIIARNGKPAAKLVPMDAKEKHVRKLGQFEGMFPSMTLEEFDADNDEIAKMFYGE